MQKALAAGSPAGGSLRDVKHVVCLMQENRSFNHYFGTMAGVRGFDDPHAISLPSGRSVFYQPDTVHADGYLLPFHLYTATSSTQAIPSTSHAWEVQHEAWNGVRWIGGCPLTAQLITRTASHDGLLYPSRHPFSVRPDRGLHYL